LRTQTGSQTSSLSSNGLLAAPQWDLGDASALRNNKGVDMVLRAAYAPARSVSRSPALRVIEHRGATMDQRQRRPRTYVFVVAAACWCAGAAGLFIWILSFVASDPSSHDAGDAMLALFVWSPGLVVALIGVVAIAAIARGWHRGRAIAIGWSLSALLVGLIASATPLTVAWLVLTGAGVQFVSGNDWIATYPRDGATYYVYPQDMLPLWFALWGLLALATSIWSGSRSRRWLGCHP
jgi:hypothetical protein